MKTAEEMLRDEIDKAEESYHGDGAYFDANSRIYDGSSDPIISAMKAYAEQERQRAFEASREFEVINIYQKDGYVDGLKTKYDTVLQFIQKNPLK